MRTLRNRSGTTIVELLVTLVIMSVIGVGMVRLMSSQSRLFNENEGTASARRVSRAGTAMLFSDLRMLESDSSVLGAGPTWITASLPYWYGISCGPDAGLSATHVAMQPIDSVMLADASYSGFGYIDSVGVAHFRPGSSVSGGTSSVCKNAGIDTVVHKRARVVRIVPASTDLPVGTPVFLFQWVSYWFSGSTAYPGSQGLYRTVWSKSLTEEVAAPFDTAARFRYWVPGSSVPVTTVSAGTPVIGMDLDIVGLNQRAAATRGLTQQAPIETSLYFRNR